MYSRADIRYIPNKAFQTRHLSSGSFWLLGIPRFNTSVRSCFRANRCSLSVLHFDARHCLYASFVFPIMVDARFRGTGRGDMGELFFDSNDLESIFDKSDLESLLDNLDAVFGGLADALLGLRGVNTATIFAIGFGSAGCISAECVCLVVLRVLEFQAGRAESILRKGSELPLSMSESRNELLAWFNDLSGQGYTKIEQFGAGGTPLDAAGHCLIMDSIYRDVPLQKVKFNAKHEYEYVANFKILQSSFDKHKIDNAIPVERLIKCKFQVPCLTQDNLEFAQWIKKYQLLTKILGPILSWRLVRFRVAAQGARFCCWLGRVAYKKEGRGP